MKDKQFLRDKFLKRLYELSNGHIHSKVNFKELQAELGLSREEGESIYLYLHDKGLAKMITFGNIAITTWGIDEVESDMKKTYAEKEYLILKTLFDESKGKDEHFTAANLAQLIPVAEDDIYYILKDFLRRGWVWEAFEDTAQITPRGVTAFHQWDQTHSPITVRDVYNTNIYGNSNNQIGGQGNAQNAINSSNMSIDDRTKNRYRVLEEIYELSGANPSEIVVIDQIEKNTQISTHEMNGILSYLENKGLIEFPGGDIVQIKSNGIDEIEQARNHPEERTDNFPPQINYITNVQGDFYGGLQQGGEGNTQNNQINVNPDFNNAIKELIELVNTSDLHYLEKEERLAEIRRIQELAQREQTPEVQQHALSKVKLLETSLKVGEMALKASPLIGILAKLFGG